MDPLSFDRKPRIPNEVLEEWPPPSGVQPRVWRDKSPEARSDWLLSRYYEEVDGQWVPKPESRGSIETSQIAQCETTVAGASITIEALIEDLKRARYDALEEFGSDEFFEGSRKWSEISSPYAYVMIVVAIVLLGLVTAALIADLFGGGDATDEADEQGGSTTSSIVSSTSTGLVEAASESTNSTDVSTTTEATEESTTSTSSTTTTTEPSSAIVVDVAGPATLHREAGIVANMLGTNLTAEAENRGVVANWASTIREQPGSASGTVTVDVEGGTVGFEVGEAWSCSDSCLDIWAYQDLSMNLSGVLDLVPSGSAWAFNGPVTIEYLAEFGRPESASDCGGTECYICADQYCTWESGVSREVTLSGSVDGDVLSVVVEDGLAADISTIDFSSLTDTEFFMARYIYQVKLPEAVPAP